MYTIFIPFQMRHKYICKCILSHVGIYANYSFPLSKQSKQKSDVLVVSQVSLVQTKTFYCEPLENTWDKLVSQLTTSDNYEMILALKWQKRPVVSLCVMGLSFVVLNQMLPLGKQFSVWMPTLLFPLRFVLSSIS